jgi:exosortase
MQLKVFKRNALLLLRLSLKNPQTQLWTCGLLLEIYYLLHWGVMTFQQALAGSSNFLIGVSLISWSGQKIWRDSFGSLRRDRSEQSKAVSEEKVLGNLLILAGIGIFFGYPATAAVIRVFACVMVLAGVLCSRFGLESLHRHWLSLLILIPGLHPNLERVARQIWDAFMPVGILEHFMAQAGSVVLRAIGFPAVSQNNLLILPTGSVNVASGCDGFSMAFTLAATGLVLGLFLAKCKRMVVLLVLCGALLAFGFNVPRVALMTIASIYWGQASFEFWHGPIGGQVFSAFLVTVYYYVAMFFLNSRSLRKPPKESRNRLS